MVDSVDDLKSSRSVKGTPGPDFEWFDARIASALNKIIQNTRFKKKVSLEEQKAPRRTVSFVEDRSLTWSTSTSGSLEPTILWKIMPTYLPLFCEMMISGIRFEMGRNSVINDANPIWWPLGRIVLIKNTRVWETQDRMEIHQKKAGPDYHRLKTMVKRSIEQNLRMKKFEARNGNFKQAPRSRIKGWNSVNKEVWDIVGNGKLTGSVQKETIAVSDTIKISVQNRHSRTLLHDLLRSRLWKMHREPEVIEAEAQVGEWLDCRARITSKELAPLHSVKKWHPPECLFYKLENGCRFGWGKCSYAHRQVDEQPSKKSQKNGDKSAVAILKNTWQFSCVSQDMDPPKSSSILRKSSNMLKPIRCVQFTEAVVRHAHIRDQNPLLGMICPGDLHQRNPNAPKFEGLKKRRNGKSDVPVKQCGGWLKAS